MMVSANDAAYAIAHTAGGLDTFADQMNAAAARMGMRDSTFNDPAGFDDATSFRGGPKTSVYDLAIATRAALRVPAIAKWAGLREHSFVDPDGVQHWLTNHNRMLPGGTYAYEGANGFKTGYTKQAQHSLVTTATRNGRTLIVALLAAPDAGYAAAASLLDAAFAMPPDAPGTGVVLPEVNVSLYANRAADRAAFAKLSTVGASAGPVTGATVPDSVPVLDQLPREPAPVAATQAASTDAASGDGGGPGPFRVRNLMIVMLSALATTVALRRRAVKRQRARRLAQRRQRAIAMRSGGLPVVDGRYRAGLRTGPPVESHVRVRRAHERRRHTG
jgi:D-alanyl-D-alanine carboxypeptidase